VAGPRVEEVSPGKFRQCLFAVKGRQSRCALRCGQVCYPLPASARTAWRADGEGSRYTKAVVFEHVSAPLHARVGEPKPPTMSDAVEGGSWDPASTRQRAMAIQLRRACSSGRRAPKSRPATLEHVSHALTSDDVPPSARQTRRVATNGKDWRRPARWRQAATGLRWPRGPVLSPRGARPRPDRSGCERWPRRGVRAARR
jgi:hypothetical protein